MEGQEQRQAFTIGFAASKEHVERKAAAGAPEVKMGYRSGKDGAESFAGSYVWKEPAGARDFLAHYGVVGTSQGAVYELLLPNGWDADVSHKPDERGVHRLLVDALIVAHVA